MAKIKWRVQVRKSRKHAWRNKGLFATRADARMSARAWRYIEPVSSAQDGYGFGNTRVVAVRGKK